MSPDISDKHELLVKEILNSRTFAKAQRLSSFLAHVCNQALRGNITDLNERQIGIDVFGRSSEYLPADDSIVRATARLLRSRLELYFSTEGKDSEWILHIPKGSYVPVFEPRVTSEPVEAPTTYPETQAIPIEELNRRQGISWRRSAALLAGLIAIGSILALVFSLYRPLTKVPISSGERLWSSLLEPKQRTLFVPADSTLSLIQADVPKPLSLSEYLADGREAVARVVATRPLPAVIANFNEYQNTSIADLEMAFRLARLPQTEKALLEIRYARELTLSEARSSNLILMGGPRSNPWVQLFADRMDYSVHGDHITGSDYVEVKDPHSGEQNRYSVELGANRNSSLGVIAFIGGLQAGQETLLIEGTDMAGTEGACDFLLDSGNSSSFLGKFARPDGGINHFEVILAIKTVNGNALEPQVLAYRALP